MKVNFQKLFAEALGKKPPIITDLGDNKTQASIECVDCREIKTITIPTDGYKLWNEGAFIQNALRSTSADDRELLLSHICKDCYEKFKEEEED
jgi:hypothetical protein